VSTAAHTNFELVHERARIRVQARATVSSSCAYGDRTGRDASVSLVQRQFNIDYSRAADSWTSSETIA